MQKSTLAITIRSFALSESVRRRLNKFLDIHFINNSERRLTEAELKDAVKNADAVIAGTEPFSRAVIESALRLKIISRVGTGLDSIDLEAASERGIRVLTTPGSTVQPVAEHTLSLILCAMKRIPEYNESVRRGDHRIKQASLLYKKTVGIIGLGRIGFRVGELLSCLGCPVLYFDPYLRYTPPDSWKRAASFRELLTGADIITLHASAPKRNVPLLNREAFNQCRKGVLVINTARGSLVDEHALVEALQRGIVAGAGLDVFMKEPYDGPLLSFPQVIVTPHVASNTRESRQAMEFEAVENLIVAIEEMN